MQRVCKNEAERPERGGVADISSRTSMAPRSSTDSQSPTILRTINNLKPYPTIKSKHIKNQNQFIAWTRFELVRASPK